MLVYEMVFDIMPFDVYFADVKDYKIVYMNKKMKDNYGDLTGGTCYSTIFEQDTPCHFCQIKNLIDAEYKPKSSSLTHEVYNEANGKWYQFQEKCMFWVDGRVVKYAVCVNTTEIKEAQNRLSEAHAELAITNNELQEKNRKLKVLTEIEALTQLYNRFKMEDILEEQIFGALKDKRRLGIILCDMDDFKAINDKHGYNVGDAALIAISKEMNQIASQKSIFGRWSGAGFLAICVGCTMECMEGLAEELRSTVEACDVPVAGKITGCFGVAEMDDGDSLKSLFKKADSALLEAKKSGPSRVAAFKK